MARTLLVYEEAVAILETIKAPARIIEQFKKQVEHVTQHKNRRVVDEIMVSSGFGQSSQAGHVELTLNDQLTQMDVKKAREVGIMLLEAAEAAQSDEIMIKLLEKIGLPPEARGGMLLHLREIRQGTRGTSWPS